MNLFKKKSPPERPARKKFGKAALYDYSDRLAREETIKFLLDYTRKERRPLEDYWRKMRSYYDGEHDTDKLLSDMFGSGEISWKPAHSPDGFIHIESQIETYVPDFEFCGRGREDSAKADQREKITRFIAESNSLEYKNLRNERRLGILGTAVWKIRWDSTIRNIGDVVIETPDPYDIYPDPFASSEDSCEYIAHSYKLHKEKARRLFKNDFSGLDYTEQDIDNLLNGRRDEYYFAAEVSSKPYTPGNFDEYEQTVRVTEWWFRQPNDGECVVTCADSGGKKTQLKYKWKSGDIALSLLVNGVEVRYIPQYWNKINCDMYPFVFYSRITSENSIWGKSELENIIPLIDAADRELAFAQLNSAFISNDIIMAEENAFSDGCEPDNRPGAIWRLRPGMMGKVQRLGNLSYAENSLYNGAERFRKLMQEATGNYDTYQGAQPTRVTTATGIALLNERAKSRMERKKVDRQAAFGRLYALCDRTALENYDDGRIISIGASGGIGAGSIIYKYSLIASDNSYLPEIDIKIHIGDGLKNSKAYTISAMSDLIRTPINADNFEFVKTFIKLIDIPQSSDLCDMLDAKFKPATEAQTDTDIPAIAGFQFKPSSASRIR